jgi:hypothetical protein
VNNYLFNLLGEGLKDSVAYNYLLQAISKHNVYFKNIEWINYSYSLESDDSKINYNVSDSGISVKIDMPEEKYNQVEIYLFDQGNSFIFNRSIVKDNKVLTTDGIEIRYVLEGTKNYKAGESVVCQGKYSNVDINYEKTIVFDKDGIFKKFETNKPSFTKLRFHEIDDEHAVKLGEAVKKLCKKGPTVVNNK